MLLRRDGHSLKSTVVVCGLIVLLADGSLPAPVQQKVTVCCSPSALLGIASTVARICWYCRMECQEFLTKSYSMLLRLVGIVPL